MTTNNFSSILQDEKLLQALTDLGITEPTPVQSAAISRAAAGKDLIVQAKTGSGKTLAFVLPIIMQIKAGKPSRATQAIVITPTRELATQVKKVIDSVSPDISPACIIGGASANTQERELRRDPRVIVGTPGRILDFIDQRIIRLNACQTFVLDEADEMLSMGFVDEVRNILKRLPPKRQGLFFSATISGRVLSLASSFLRQPESIVIESGVEDAPKIEHLFIRTDGGVTSKVNALCRLLTIEKSRSAIIFCNTKSDTELVESVMLRRGFNASRINSDLSQKQRDKVLEQLRDGKLQFLIATDVAARGIDIKELELVVNYALHDEPEVYVHRTGRTGRAGASGKAISLISPLDFGAFYALQKKLPVPLTEMTLPAGDEKVAA